MPSEGNRESGVGSRESGNEWQNQTPSPSIQYMGRLVECSTPVRSRPAINNHLYSNDLLQMKAACAVIALRARLTHDPVPAFGNLAVAPVPNGQEQRQMHQRREWVK